MVKEFLKCNSIRERIQFLANIVLKDWDTSESDTVMDIMGLLRGGMEAPEDRISAIEKYLADYRHKAKMRGGVDGSKVDNIPAEDQVGILFKGPSEAEVMSEMLNLSFKERQARSNFQMARLVSQYIAAVITRCVAPFIIITGVAGLYGGDRVIIVQTAFMVSALATFSRIFLAGFKKDSPQFGAELLLIVGGGFIILCGSWAAGRHQFLAGRGGCDRRRGRDGLGSHG